MAHLPKKVNEIVFPFLKSFAQKYNDTGSTLKTFEINDSTEPSNKEQNYLGFDLDCYHWWFVSHDNFDHKFYSKLDAYIKKFNSSQDICNLDLSNQVVNQMDICRITNEDDGSGSVYFLVRAQKKDDSNFLYNIPKKYKKDMMIDDKKNIGYNIKIKKHSNNIITFYRHFTQSTIFIRFVDDKTYNENYAPIASYNESYFSDNTKKQTKEQLMEKFNNDNFSMNYVVVVL